MLVLAVTREVCVFLSHDVQEVCFVPVAERERSCVTVEQGSSLYSVRALHPQVVVPGEQFRVEIFISLRSPYQLKPGDFLSNTSEGDEALFGVWPHMAVDKTVESGEPFLFTDYDNPVTIPQLSDGENSGEKTTTWRVWMHTRYVGPYIQIAFNVQNPANESEDVEK